MCQVVWLHPVGVVHRQVPQVDLAHLVPEGQQAAGKVETEANVPDVTVVDFKSENDISSDIVSDCCVKTKVK